MFADGGEEVGIQIGAPGGLNGGIGIQQLNGALAEFVDVLSGVPVCAVRKLRGGVFAAEKVAPECLVGVFNIAIGIKQVVGELIGGTDQIAAFGEGDGELFVVACGGKAHEGKEGAGFAAGGLYAVVPGLRFAPVNDFLQDFGFADLAEIMNQGLGQSLVFEGHEEFKGVEDEEVSEENGTGSSVFFPVGGGAAPDVTVVYHVVVEEAGGMNEFDGGGGTQDGFFGDGIGAAQANEHPGAEHFALIGKQGGGVVQEGGKGRLRKLFGNELPYALNIVVCLMRHTSENYLGKIKKKGKRESGLKDSGCSAMFTHIYRHHGDTLFFRRLVMEEKISRAVLNGYFKKLTDCLSVDVAIVGAGPSGLIAAQKLAIAGKKVAIFERSLAPGGGTWSGGMLFNELVVQENVLPILEEFGIRYESAGDGIYTADSVETASALIYHALKAGAKLFNSVTVEDVMFKAGRVCGIVINWTPVHQMGLHVDPLAICADAVLDSTGHPSEVVALACRKAGIEINTPTGGVMGEKPMWTECGEISTVENTKRLYPGLYASGMAANNASGGFRMGPVFGGMFLSGKKVADLIMEDLL